MGLRRASFDSTTIHVETYAWSSCLLHAQECDRARVCLCLLFGEGSSVEPVTTFIDL